MIQAQSNLDSGEFRHVRWNMNCVQLGISDTAGFFRRFFFIFWPNGGLVLKTDEASNDGISVELQP